MAIEVTERLIRIDVSYPGSGDGDPIIYYVVQTSVDDPDDARLPITTSTQESLTKLVPVTTENSDGSVTNGTEEADITHAPQAVQDVAAVVWA